MALTKCNKCKNEIDAAKNGHLECLKYFRKNGPLDNSVVAWTAKYGHLECLKYAHQNGCRLYEYVCGWSALNGHLECLMYAFENDCSSDVWTCAWAALGGHLDCLKYAHENGCPWDVYTCIYAAENGHLECLKYARENKCPWHIESCARAFENGHLECLKYAREKGCLCKHHTDMTYGNLQYAHENKLFDEVDDVESHNENTDECGICYHNCNKVQFKPCNHKLCISCSNQLIARQPVNCPFCRASVVANFMLRPTRPQTGRSSSVSIQF